MLAAGKSFLTGAAKGPVELTSYATFTKKGPSTLTEVTYSPGDLLFCASRYNYGAGQTIPGPSGWTRLSPNPDFTNLNMSWCWKVATSSSEYWYSALGDATPTSTVLVFKNGGGIGGYGVRALTYTSSTNIWYPTITMEKSDGTSFVMLANHFFTVPAGWTTISSTGLDYPLYKLNDTKVATVGGNYVGAYNQGLAAIVEIKNTP